MPELFLNDKAIEKAQEVLKIHQISKFNGEAKPAISEITLQNTGKVQNFLRTGLYWEGWNRIAG